jgi:hypothetical protein
MNARQINKPGGRRRARPRHGLTASSRGCALSRGAREGWRIRLRHSSLIRLRRAPAAARRASSQHS